MQHSCKGSQLCAVHWKDSRPHSWLPAPVDQLIVWHMLLVCPMFQSIIYLEDMPVCRAQCKPPNSLQSTFMSCKAANCFIMKCRIQQFLTPSSNVRYRHT